MSTSFAFGPFVLDTRRGKLLREGKPVAISSRGLLLLEALLAAPGETVTRAVLMHATWGDAAVEESNLSVQIAALRKQLGPAIDGGDWIATVPRVGYRFVGHSARRASEPLTQSDEDKPRPSIAVMPFADLSPDGGHEYLADGISEDIITALTRFRWFSVASRHSSFAFKGASLDVRQIAQTLGVQYLLEGSVRKSGQSARISAQLVDATSGNHIWAERYDLEWTEVFAIQDEIAERVAGSVEPELLRTEGAQAASRHTGNMTAWDLVRRGTWHFHKVTGEDHRKARELFRLACELDPDLPEAHLWLGRVNAGIVPYGWSDDISADLKEGTEAAIKAVQLDGQNPYSHYALAITSVFGERFPEAISAAQRAIEISRTFALGHLVLGMALLYSGRASEAIAPLERGLRLSANDPQNFVWLNVLAFARLFSGDAEAALKAATRATQFRPGWPTSLEVLACCYGALGKPQEAAQCVQQLAISVRSGDVFGPLKAHNPDWDRKIIECLREASELDSVRE